MTKTLTQHLENHQKAGKGIFLPYPWLVITRKVCRISRNYRILENLVCQPLKSACHFQTLLQMGRLLKKPV